MTDPYIYKKCPSCGKELHFRGDSGTIQVTCPFCGNQFRFSGSLEKKLDTMFGSSPQQGRATRQTVQSPPPQRPAEQPCRTLTIVRGKHAYKNLDFAGLRNRFQDSMPIQILLDGVNQGNLDPDRKMVLNIDSRAHKLAFTILSSAYTIPAGTDSYLAMFFNKAFRITPLEDPFRDQLEQFILRMVRGQGFRDRILDRNNRNHTVEVRLTSTCIEVFMPLAQTKGLAQWSTGGQTEKIYYQNIGLTPLPKDRQPGGYWDYLNDYIREVIEADDEADLTHVAGGFTVRTSHKLY